MMNDLKARLRTAVLMITHDLGIVAEMCDRVAVIYAGEILETGPVRLVFERPMHPYTIGLFESLPGYKPDSTRLQPIQGMMPDPSDLPDWCRFEERCGRACADCRGGSPQLTEVEPGHFVRCLHAGKGAE